MNNEHVCRGGFKTRPCTRIRGGFLPAIRKNRIAGFLLGDYNRDKSCSRIVCYRFLAAFMVLFLPPLYTSPEGGGNKGRLSLPLWEGDGSAYAFETKSAQFSIDLMAFANGGGSSSSAGNRLSFAVIGEGYVAVAGARSSQYRLILGMGNLLSAFNREKDARPWIADLTARTGLLGELIPQAVWQKDDDPYFSWNMALSAETSWIQGFSYALDNQPAGGITTRDTHCQFPEHSIPSGRHVFYVMPVDIRDQLQPLSALSFEIWVDTAVPAASEMLPAAGFLLADNHAVVQCRVRDAESGIAAGLTQFSLNNHTAGFSYNNDTGLLTLSSGTILQEGKNTALVKAFDNVGNSITQGWEFTVDTQPPAGSIRINNDAAAVYSAYVALNLNARDAVSAVTSVFISNDGLFDTEMTQPYAYKPLIENWKLAEADVDGEKNVFVRFRDAAGNISPSYSAHIMLRRRTPDTRILAGPDAVTEKTAVEFRFEATKPGCLFSYTTDGREWTAWTVETRAAFENLAPGNHVFQVKSGLDLNGDREITAEEEDLSPAQWVWTVRTAGTPEELREKILFWKR